MKGDGDLITGLSSASFASSRPTRSTPDKKKEEARSILTPTASLLKDLIASERTKVTEQLANLPINLNTSEENVRSTLLAYQMNLRFIDSFETKLNNKLRGGKRSE